MKKFQSIMVWVTNETFIVTALLFLAFAMRVFTATTMPLVIDEQDKFVWAEEVSFDPQNPNIPISREKIAHSLLAMYIMMFGQFFFGDSLLSGRIFFVLMGTASLYFIYGLVRDRMGKSVGLLALFLLVFDQFHIGESCQMREEAPLLMFAAMALYFFFKALDSNKRYIYLAALSLGIGYLSKEIIMVLPFAFIVFILMKRKYRRFFSVRQILFSFSLMIIPAVPYLLWCVKNNFINYKGEDFELGFSLRLLYLYFGEILAFIIDRSTLFSYDVMNEAISFIPPNGRPVFISGTSNEYPFVHWVTGLLVFSSILYSLRKDVRKNEFVLFCLLLFFSISFFTSIFTTPLLDSHWRASLTIFPGLILSANMLVREGRRHRFFKHFSMVLLVYFVLHAIFFIQRPLSFFTGLTGVYSVIAH